MSIELFVFAITVFCGICFLCGFYIAKRIYKPHTYNEIWETICGKCYTVRHSLQPLVGNCPRCGESKLYPHKVGVE